MVVKKNPIVLIYTYLTYHLEKCDVGSEESNNSNIYIPYISSVEV